MSYVPIYDMLQMILASIHTNGIYVGSTCRTFKWYQDNNEAMHTYCDDTPLPYRIYVCIASLLSGYCLNARQIDIPSTHLIFISTYLITF